MAGWTNVESEKVRKMGIVILISVLALMLCRQLDILYRPEPEDARETELAKWNRVPIAEPKEKVGLTKRQEAKVHRMILNGIHPVACAEIVEEMKRNNEQK